MPARRPAPASTDLALQIAQLLDERHAESIAILDVSGPLVIADYFVIATVRSTRQAQSIAREVDQSIKQSRGRRKRNTGGLEGEDSNWVLLDFDDVIVHLFLPEARSYYGLESLWADVPRLPFTPTQKAAPQPTEIRNPVLEGFGLLQPASKPLRIVPPAPTSPDSATHDLEPNEQEPDNPEPDDPHDER